MGSIRNLWHILVKNGKETEKTRTRTEHLVHCKFSSLHSRLRFHHFWFDNEKSRAFQKVYEQSLSRTKLASSSRVDENHQSHYSKRICKTRWSFYSYWWYRGGGVFCWMCWRLLLKDAVKILQMGADFCDAGCDICVRSRPQKQPWKNAANTVRDVCSLFFSFQ